jgi:hypothetical protein
MAFCNKGNMQEIASMMLITLTVDECCALPVLSVPHVTGVEQC